MKKHFQNADLLKTLLGVLVVLNMMLFLNVNIMKFLAFLVFLLPDLLPEWWKYRNEKEKVKNERLKYLLDFTIQFLRLHK